MAKLAVQLWSLQEKTAEDFRGTLKRVSEMGYDGVEFAGFGGIEAAEMKKLLDEYGLEASGAHIRLDELENNLDEIAEYNKTIGNKYIVCPMVWIESEADCVNFHKRMCVVAERLKEYGIVMGYHNHEREFKKYNGVYANDIIIGDDGKLIYEIDVYWTTYAGIDTVEYIKKAGKRCPLVHLKDMQICDDGSKKDTTFGDGVVEHKKVLSAALESCCSEWLIIEWEGFGDMDAFDAVERGLNNLKSILKEI